MIFMFSTHRGSSTCVLVRGGVCASTMVGESTDSASFIVCDHCVVCFHQTIDCLVVYHPLLQDVDFQAVSGLVIDQSLVLAERKARGVLIFHLTVLREGGLMNCFRVS